jgi:hypothetical protein
MPTYPVVNSISCGGEHCLALLSQLRAMVERDVFWQNPKKRRWAKRRLWWRENRGWVIVTVLTLLIGTAAMLGTYINLYLTHARP